MKKAHKIIKCRNSGITLIVLVITIIILLILVGVTIAFLTGENGILKKSTKAAKETEKQTATEIINLKITNAQIDSYTQKQRMPTLKELSLALKEDEEIEYITQSSKIASVEYNVNSDNPDKIYTKLKEYPYEFQIDQMLKLTAIDGIQIAETPTESEEDRELKNIVELLQTQLTSQKETITSLQTELTSQQETITSLHTELQQVKQEKYDYTLNVEKKIGTWYDGTPMYEISLAFTMPSASADGEVAEKNIDVKSYNIKECIIYDGFTKSVLNNDIRLPIWINTSEINGIRMYYNSANKSITVRNTATTFNGSNAYMTLHYTKNK